MLRVQADHAIERADTAERKNKSLELNLLQKEQEVTSLTRRYDVLEVELEKTRDRLKSSETKYVSLSNFIIMLLCTNVGTCALRRSN